MTKLFCWFIFFNGCYSVVQEFALNEENITSIYYKVLSASYHKEVAPIKQNAPVHVLVNLYINDMVPLENVDMHFSMDTYLRMQWDDHRLAFDPSNPNQFVPFDNSFAKEIWKPNIYFPFGKKGNIHDMLYDNVLLNLYGNGTVRYSVRLSLLTFCPMILTFYPFDIQDCEVKIECYAYSNKYVILSWMDPPYERSGKNLHISDYNKVDLTPLKETHNGDYNQTFDTLKLKITFDRDFTLYFLRDFFPCVMIVMLSWISFWINHKAVPARVALGITTVLTIVTMTNSIRATAPKAKSFRSLDYYMLLCMMFVFGALGEFALVGMSYSKTKRHWLIEQRKNKQKPSTLDTSNNNSKEGQKKDNVTSSRVTPLTPETNKVEPKVRFFGPFVIFDQDQHIVDNVSKLFFPIAFLMCNGIYFLYHRFHPDTVN